MVIYIWQLLNFSDTFNFGFTQPHLALVMENGSVWNIKSSDQFKTIEKNLLIQLPKPRDIPHYRTLNYYHSFSTNNGVLNFVKDDISSNIIQYHDSLNNQNHTTVKGSSLKLEKEDNGLSCQGNNLNYCTGLKFRHGLQVGSMFWLLFGEYHMLNHMVSDETIFKTSTMLWFSNKQQWRRGPDLQLNPNTFNTFCSSSLNSTAILFVFIDNAYARISKVAIFNFQLKAWTDIPKMNEELQDVYYITCAIATLFGKQTRPRVLVVLNGIYEYDSMLVYITGSPILVQFLLVQFPPVQIFRHTVKSPEVACLAYSTFLDFQTVYEGEI